MLETHPLLHRTYPIIDSPLPGLWQVHTHYGISHINASHYQLVGRRMECVMGPSNGAGLTARTLDEYASALPLCYTTPGSNLTRTNDFF